MNERYAILSFLGKCPAKLSLFLRIGVVQSINIICEKEQGNFEESVNRPNVVGKQALLEWGEAFMGKLSPKPWSRHMQVT